MAGMRLAVHGGAYPWRARNGTQAAVRTRRRSCGCGQLRRTCCLVGPLPPNLEKLRARQYEFTRNPQSRDRAIYCCGRDIPGARNHMYYKTKRAGAGVFWLDPTASVRRVAVTLAGEILPLREVRIRRQVGAAPPF